MNPSGVWSRTDELLATALKLDDLAKCPGCGQYADEAHDPDMDGGYEVDDVVCNACAARDRHLKDAGNKDKDGLLTVIRKLTQKPRKRRG